MKWKLSTLLIVCLLLGAVVTPYGFRRYQAWKRREEAATVPGVFALQYVEAGSLANVLRVVYKDRVVTTNGGGDLSITVNQQANRLLIGAPQDLLVEIRDLIRQIDQPGIAASERLDCFPDLPPDAKIVRRALNEMFGGK